MKPQHRAEFDFVVPHAGQWILRGLIRSSDASSDSFWVEIDGNQATGTVNLWDAGPIGAAYSLTIAPSAPVLALSLPENTAADASGAGNHPSNPITVIHRTPYEQWAFENGIDGSTASQLADEDEDGIVKLLEFAFNLDPANPGRSIYNPAVVPSSGLPRMIVTPGPALSLQYLRRKGVAGLGYRPQFGSLPDNFIDAADSPMIESIDANWERATISDPAGGGLPRRFGRVVVT